MFDEYENLAGIVSEVQDGGLALSNTAAGPKVLVLGTATQGPAEMVYKVTRDQEAEVLFGLDGSLVRGMYETRAGGSIDTYLYRIGAESAILMGVGTASQSSNPTFIETLMKDGSAADVYFIRYTNPATLGPNAVIGRLQVKNALGEIVFDNNPGGSHVDTGEVIVSGTFSGGVNIGSLLDVNDFVSMRLVANDKVQVSNEVTGVTYSHLTLTPTVVALAHGHVVLGTPVVKIAGTEIAKTNFTLVPGVTVDSVSLLAGLTPDGAVTVSYQYDAVPAMNLKDGKDGSDLSKMELYEALEVAYSNLENDESDIYCPMDVYLDDLNVADGGVIVLSDDPTLSAGRAFPVSGSAHDGLGKLFAEEYQGTTYFFWDINGDGHAEIFPSVGSASSTTTIDGQLLTLAMFKEVNFAYQLANFCFRQSANDNDCDGMIGVNMPNSLSKKDIAQWVGSSPTLNPVTGAVSINGSGLLGNKFMAGSTNRTAGFFATYSGELPVGNLDANGDIVKDRGGHKVDIGKYLSVCAMPLIYFNNFQELGYQASMATFYAGFVSTLAVKSAPTNKPIIGVNSPFSLSKAKLNALSGAHFVALKEKGGVLRISDSPTAAMSASDFTRLTTKRITSEAISIVRTVGEPYIGEPNTAITRESLKTSLTKALAQYQSDGNITRFDLVVSATNSQVILGQTIVELTLVPAFEMRKIVVITSLAKA